MSKFELGQSKPEGSGRKKGTPNRRDTLLRDLLADKGVDVAESIINLLPELPPAKRVEVLISLLPFTYAKLKPMSYEDEVSGCSQCNHIFKMSPQDQIAHAENMRAKRLALEAFERDPLDLEYLPLDNSEGCQSDTGL